MKKRFLLLAAALALGLLAGCGGEKAPGPSAASSQLETSSPAGQGTAAALGSLASFSAATLDGSGFSQDNVKARDVTVVNFWSTTCPPCIAELPDLAEFSKALPDNVQVITVCLDGYGNEQTVANIVQQTGFDGAVLLAGDGDLLALSRNLMYTPTTVFADSNGQLIGDPIIGAQKDLPASFLAAVNQVLAAGGKDAVSLTGQ